MAHLSNSKWSYGHFQKAPEIVTSGGFQKAVLFDLEKDPTQQKNIIEHEKEIAKELHKKLIEHLKAINAPDNQIEKFIL